MGGDLSASQVGVPLEVIGQFSCPIVQQLLHVLALVPS